MQPSVTRPAPSPERPGIVTVAAILAAIAGVVVILGVLAGAFLIHGLASLDAGDALIVTPGIVLAGMYLTFASGAWTLKPWAWGLGVVAALGTIVYTAVILVAQWGELMRDAPPLAWMGVVVAIVAAIGLGLWFRSDVTAAFDRD
jgi:drug/metabolite transporter (DMT)-like permease